MIINFIKELIKRDILVVSGGCGNYVFEVVGLCIVEVVNEIVGDGLKEVCNMLKIFFVLSFGICIDIGRILMFVIVFVDYLDVDVFVFLIVVIVLEWME